MNICGRAMRSKTEQRSRAGFSHGTPVTAGRWALGLERSLKRTCTPCSGQRVAGWGSRRLPVLPARAFSPCCRCPRPRTFCRSGAGFMARVVPSVLRHTTWCRRAHRLSTRRPGPTLTNASAGEVGRPEKTASSDTVTTGKVAEMWQVWQVPGGLTLGSYSTVLSRECSLYGGSMPSSHVWIKG